MAKSKGEKQPDYILVAKEENLPGIEFYLDNLRVLGLDFENEAGKVNYYYFVDIKTN